MFREKIEDLLVNDRIKHRSQHHTATETHNCGHIKGVAPGKGPLRSAKYFGLVKVKRTVNVIELVNSSRTS